MFPHCVCRRSTGFVLEGFPRTADEARYLAEVGLFPDAALIMTVSDGDVIGRLLPPKLEKWRVKRDKRLAKKAKKKEKAKKKRVRGLLISLRRVVCGPFRWMCQVKKFHRAIQLN